MKWPPSRRWQGPTAGSSIRLDWLQSGMLLDHSADTTESARSRKDRQTVMRDFNDFQFFTAVVLHRGFSAAARVLGVPKSRISRRVALLEERLGVRLLDRTTRGLGLTQVGPQGFDPAHAAVYRGEASPAAGGR